MTIENLSPSCSVCTNVAATVTLERIAEGFRYVFASPAGGNGAGDLVTAEFAARLRAALTLPFSEAKLRTVGLDRWAGFCRACGVFYCADHWGARVHAGAGNCPKGHDESMDPHWSPDD